MAEGHALTRAKAFVRRLRLALPRVLRDTKVQDVHPDQFLAGGKLGRSTPKLMAYLNGLSLPVGKLEADLAPYFKPTGASTELQMAQAELSTADATQEIGISALPADTLQVYEHKGHLTRCIEDLNRAGKMAFDGDAVQAARFNKDILLRGRKAKVVAAVAVGETV